MPDTAPNTTMEEDPYHWHQAGRLSELDPQEPTQARVANKMIALCRDGDEVFAISDICSHEFAFLSDGIIEDGCVECPLHQGRFDFRSGKAVAAPAIDDIPTYPTRVDGDIIWVGYPAKRK